MYHIKAATGFLNQKSVIITKVIKITNYFINTKFNYQYLIE